MPEQFEYKLLEKYPGMRPRDEYIWDDYVQKHPQAFTSVYYNVPLGDPFPEDDAKIEAKANGAYEVSQWRIDALAEDDTAIYVIEIKPDAGAGALGQALAYVKLIQKEWNIIKPIYPVVLTDKITPVMEQAAKMLGVLVLIP